ncbi:MAG: hypothetical protein MUF75_10935 [Bacteroidia bacterium]|nr:hypothetical protein [Bacteroidia bacterium]
MKAILGSVAIAALTLVASCEKMKIKPTNQEEAKETMNGLNQRVTITGTANVSCVSLVAGQNINAGSLCFDDIDTNNDNIDDALKVTYNTTDGWELTQIHFWIGESSTTMPVTRNGNPIPGQFPYTASFSTTTSSYTFAIPFTALNFSCPNNNKSYQVAAHAAVRKLVNGVYQNETAWGAGERIASKGNWGMKFGINISCDETPTPGTCPETAWAKANDSSNCFTNLAALGAIDANRWGWTNKITSAGVYTMTLWAGAGQCNTNNGTNVGVLTVNYTGSSATVSYAATGVYSFDEIHLYVGNTQLYYHQGNNLNQTGYTVSPGQFPIKPSLGANTTTWTSAAIPVSGTIYVTAHAVVKGFTCPSL